MIHAKNYATVFKFVKVMPRKLVAVYLLIMSILLTQSQLERCRIWTKGECRC